MTLLVKEMQELLEIRISLSLSRSLCLVLRKTKIDKLIQAMLLAQGMQMEIKWLLEMLGKVAIKDG